MRGFLEGVGYAVLFIGLAVAIRSCTPENKSKPLVGRDGIVWRTEPSSTKER